MGDRSSTQEMSKSPVDPPQPICVDGPADIAHHGVDVGAVEQQLGQQLHVPAQVEFESKI